MSIALLLLPDFLLIAGGAALKRWGGFEAAFWTGLERLVYFVLFPALLFRSLAISPLGIADADRLVGVGLAFTLVGMLLSALAQPLFRLPHSMFAACFQCGFRFNTYIALAVASSIGGEAAVAAISLLIGILVPVVNVVAVGMLARGQRGRIGNELARNPLIVACAAGIAWKIAGLPLPSLASTCPRSSRKRGAAARTSGGRRRVDVQVRASCRRLRFCGGARSSCWRSRRLALLFANLVSLSPLERQVAVTMAAMPTAPSAYILANQMSGNGAPVALLISTATVLAAITLPLWIALAG